MLYIPYDEEGLPKFGHGISHPGVEFEGWSLAAALVRFSRLYIWHLLQALVDQPAIAPRSTLDFIVSTSAESKGKSFNI
jgi:hypothetical protein